MRQFYVAAIASLLTFMALFVTTQTNPRPLTPATIFTQPGETFAQFGFAVAATGQRVAIGAPQALDGLGAVYLRDVSGNTLATLTNPGDVGDGFGFSVAAIGNNILVGAPDAGGIGVVYVFDGDPKSKTFGGELAMLVSPHPNFEDRFGFALAAADDGRSAIIGSPSDDSDGIPSSGAAYLFNVNPKSAGFGQVTTTFHDPAPVADGAFGDSVAGLGTTVLIGAPLNNAQTGGGTAYVFTIAGVLTQTVRGSMGADFFGAAVAFLGPNLLVGAPFDSAQTSNGGAAYIFDASKGTQLAVLRSPTPEPDDWFGARVAAVGPNAVVGAPGSELSEADLFALHPNGKVFMFDGRPGSQTFGTLLQTFSAPFQQPSDHFDQFGQSIAPVQNGMVVGAPGTQSETGAAYLFRPCTGQCPPFCGDGVVQTGEQCDDANLVDGDGCDTTCVFSPTTTSTTTSTSMSSTTTSSTTTTISPNCGNGVVDPGEDCDPPFSACLNFPFGFCEPDCHCSGSSTTSTSTSTSTTTSTLISCRSNADCFGGRHCCCSGCSLVWRSCCTRPRCCAFTCPC